MICYECPNNFISHEYLQLLPLLFWILLMLLLMNISLPFFRLKRV
jgi:hypothetical protein